MTVVIVIALRLVAPLSILRWPLVGGLVSMLLHSVDVVPVGAVAADLGTPARSARSTPSRPGAGTSLNGRTPPVSVWSMHRSATTARAGRHGTFWQNVRRETARARRGGI